MQQDIKKNLIACGVDAICNVNFQESESLIRHYANLISLDLD